MGEARLLAADIRWWPVIVSTPSLCNPSVIDTFRTADAGEPVNVSAAVKPIKINVRGDACAYAVSVARRVNASPGWMRRVCLPRAEFLAELILQSSVLTFTQTLAGAQNAQSGPVQTQPPWDAFHLRQAAGVALTFQGIISKPRGEKLLLNISCASVAVACDRAGVRGRCFGRFSERGHDVDVQSGGPRRAAVLRVGVKGDTTLKSNYTAITSSLIKRRATGLIQPCDPAKTRTPALVGIAATRR